MKLSLIGRDVIYWQIDLLIVVMAHDYAQRIYMNDLKSFHDDFDKFKVKSLAEINRVKTTVQKRSYFDGISDECGFYANLDVSRTLVICFSGFKQNVAGIQPFEFFNTFSDCNAQTLFLKDPSKTWFLSGIPGFGDSVDMVVDNILKLKKQFNIERIVTIGGSSGGFASLLYGSILGADRAVALMPQTFVDPVLRKDKNITIYEKNVNDLYRLAPDSAVKHGDIKKNIMSCNGGETNTQYHIFYPNYRDDVVFAEYLSGLENVCLYKAKHDTHSLGQFMKENSMLKPLVMSTIYGLDVRHTIKSSFQNKFEEL